MQIHISATVSVLLSTAVLAASQGQSASASAENNLTKKHLKEQMEREKKYSREQKFYGPKDYDFKGVEVSPESVKKIKAIEPEYDFDMDEGVYSD